VVLRPDLTVSPAEIVNYGNYVKKVSTRPAVGLFPDWQNIVESCPVDENGHRDIEEVGLGPARCTDGSVSALAMPRSSRIPIYPKYGDCGFSKVSMSDLFKYISLTSSLHAMGLLHACTNRRTVHRIQAVS
jgi:hypothetical protein